MRFIGWEPRRSTVKNRPLFFAPGEAFCPADWIRQECRLLGHRWRDRMWEPVLTFWACILKQMQNGCGARWMEHWAALHDVADGNQRRDGADFTRARSRLPEHLFYAALRKLYAALRPGARKLMGKWVVLIADGTTFRAPDTPANRAELGVSRNALGNTRWPLLRAVLLTCAGSGAVADLAVGGFQVSERSLLKQLLDRLAPGFLVIADRGFCSFLALWHARRKGSHVLCRLHQTRRRHNGQRIGYNEYLCRWPKKGLRFTRCRAWQAVAGEVKEDLWVRIIERAIIRRGYRRMRLTLVTTLLDAEAYPANELLKLYVGRWDVEVDIRSLKADFGLARLTAKTPAVARKEVLSGMLACNLVCLWKAKTGDDPRARSSRTTRTLVLWMAERMAEASHARLLALERILIREIRRAVIPLQPRPPQPRLIVGRLTYYGFLRIPRKEWHRKYLASSA